MRIIYIHQYFNLPTGQSSTRSYEMAKRLAARGHDVHMVTTDRESGTGFRGWRTQHVAGYTVHRTHVPYSNSLGVIGRLRAFFRFARKAGLKARALKGDVVFASSTPLTIALPARVATLGRSTPLVFEVRDLWPEVPIAMGVLGNPILRWTAYALQRFAYRNAAHIVALSPDMKAGVVERGYPASRVTVIPNSSDLDVFAAVEGSGAAFRAKHDWLGSNPLALYCGTLGRVNEASYLVELAQEAQAVRPNHRFLVIGDGSEREALIAEARLAGVLDRNFFVFDRLPKDELAPIYAAATVALSTVAPVPALWANSANKVFDAFAAGRPVAINHRGWQADLLQTSGAGVVMDPQDIPSALATLSTVMDDPARATNAGRQAQRLATERFARDLHGAQLADVLEQVRS